MLDKAPVPAIVPQAAVQPPAMRGPEAQSDILGVLNQGRSRRYILRAIIATVAIVIAAAGSYWWFNRPAGAGLTYTTVPVAHGNLTVSVSATGTIQPIDVVDVSSELSGTIGTVTVDFNDRVKAGQTLATLKTDKLAATVEQGRAQVAAREADVAQAKATADQTTTALNRAKQLRAIGTITQEALDTAQSAADKATAGLSAADANRQIAVANLSIAQSDLTKATIVSPIDGVVLNRNADVGQTVAASLSAPILFTLAQDLRKMQLEVNIDEADVGQVKEGDKALFTVAAYQDKSFPAEVAQVRYASAKVEGVVTYKAVLSVDNSAQQLRPGMTATATITVNSVNNALLVPNAALRYTPPAAARPGGLLGGLIRPPPGAVVAGPGVGPPPGGVPPGAVLFGPGGGALGGGAAGAPGGAGGGQTLRVVQPPGTVQAARIVWVLKDGKPIAVPVRTGATDGSRTEIVGGGLTDSDVVITGSKAAP